MRTIEGEVFLVTGGAGAIAHPILAAFVEAGARVGVVDRAEDSARARAAELPAGRAIPIHADLTTAEGAAAMVRAVEVTWGRLDGLVHTAGGFAMGNLDAVEASEYDRLLDMNVRTTFHAVRAVLPPLRARGAGFLCAFASEPAITGAAPGAALYGAAKSAVATLLHSVDGELAGTDVAVSVVYPMGPVDTPANRAAMPDADPQGFIDPVDIAETIVHAARRSRRGRLRDLAIYPPRPRSAR
jgi:NADP-dependent 3-hydroxy acid dehydrogenase YdfG